MTQAILIPGLGGTIQVGMSAWFDPGPGETEFQNGFDDTVKLPDRTLTTTLKIQAAMIFPTHTWPPTGHTSKGYSYYVHGRFSNIEQRDEKLVFANTEVAMQALGAPSPPGAEQSLFRFIDGKAWLSASNNPRVCVVKIKLVLGSQDVYVMSWEESHQDAQWSVEVGKEGGKDANEAGVGGWVKDRIVGPAGKVIDVIRSLTGKIGRSGAVDTSTRGTQFTPGQLSAQPEWTWSLVLPEPKPKPQPALSLAWHKVYFLTGKADLLGANNDPGKFPDKQDQIKALQIFMDGVQAKFGGSFKYLESIELLGHASGLGDTGKNLGLSLARANYVKKLIWDIYKVQIPMEKIFAKGEPLTAGNDKDNTPEDRRVDVNVFIRK